jgi:hypothetical protein
MARVVQLTGGPEGFSAVRGSAGRAVRADTPVPEVIEWRCRASQARHREWIGDGVHRGDGVIQGADSSTHRRPSTHRRHSSLAARAASNATSVIDI